MRYLCQSDTVREAGSQVDLINFLLKYSTAWRCAPYKWRTLRLGGLELGWTAGRTLARFGDGFGYAHERVKRR
jgi:hypothetical protein